MVDNLDEGGVSKVLFDLLDNIDKEKYEVIGIDIGIDTNTIPNEKSKDVDELIKEILLERGCYCETCNID